jgi:uncharacterized membrane protein YjgN (DUF898 family)
MITGQRFEFHGTGLGYIWLLAWTVFLSIITFGLFFPWAFSAQMRWITSNTTLNGRPLEFVGTGLGFFFQWLLILVLSILTFGLYAPWGYCRLKRWELENTILP